MGTDDEGSDLSLIKRQKSKMKKRFQYTFSGYVQGVGFRYRAYRAAHQLGLTVWVRNEYDGSVTMEVQGEQDKIDAMLETVENSPYISIDNLKAKELNLQLNEKHFEIYI